MTTANAVPGGPLPSVTNCADVAFTSSSGLTDGNASNNQSCVTNGTQTGTQTDLGIQKTMTTHGHGQDILGYTYTLVVTNVGAPVNGQNTVTVTDVVPAGLSFASATGTNWSCTGPFPIAAGGTLTCTYTASGTLATGQALPPITADDGQFHAGHGAAVDHQLRRCRVATGSGLTDSDASNNHSCASTGSLTVIKVVKPSTRPRRLGSYIPGECLLRSTEWKHDLRELRPRPGGQLHHDRLGHPVGIGLHGHRSDAAAAARRPGELPLDTTYPDGQQATVRPATSRCISSTPRDCTGPATQQPTVLIAKTVVIDGRVSYAPHESFPIRATAGSRTARPRI